MNAAQQTETLFEIWPGYYQGTPKQIRNDFLFILLVVHFMGVVAVKFVMYMERGYRQDTSRSL
jgi:hypothetical protein